MKRQMEINKGGEESRYLHWRRRVFFNFWFCCVHCLAAHGFSMKSRLASDHLLLNICTNLEDFAKYQNCKEECQEFPELSPAATVYLKLESRITFSYQSFQFCNSDHWIQLFLFPAAVWRSGVWQCLGCLGLSWVLNLTRATFPGKTAAIGFISCNRPSLERFNLNPAGEPNHTRLRLGRWSHLTAFQEIVFCIDLNHQSAQRMNIIQEGADGQLELSNSADWWPMSEAEPQLCWCVNIVEVFCSFSYICAELLWQIYATPSSIVSQKQAKLLYLPALKPCSWFVCCLTSQQQRCRVGLEMSWDHPLRQLRAMQISAAWRGKEGGREIL